jgi:hypothetical protein
MRFPWRRLLALAIPVLFSRPLWAQLGATVPNWEVPRGSGAHGGMTTQSDLTPGVAFVGMTPCRIVDTRGPAGTFGGPALTTGVPRSFALPSGPCAGIPAAAEAYSLNVTAVSPAATGFVKIYPQGGTAPVVSTVNFSAHVTTANAAVVPSGTGGGVTAASSTGTHLLIDINGYYTKSYNAGVQFAAVASVDGAAAVLGQNNSNANGSHGVGGFAGGTGTVHGVQGQIGSGSDFGSSGVHGIAGATTDQSFGVLGQSLTDNFDSAGVKGIDYTGPVSSTAFFTQSGVRGEGVTGVIGITSSSSGDGVRGTFISGGVTHTAGRLGLLSYGVYSSGDFGGTGAKYFVEPHPIDATKVIRYVALEGPESGTYFRGTGHTIGGRAVIEVPETFRIVTDEEGLTVQLTAVGPPTLMSVEREDLAQIVVRSSNDVTFHYLVQGVRRAFKDFQPVTEGDEFMPRTPEDRMPAYLTEEAKRRLIANGTYNADGTVNLATAERAGWTALWAERDAAARARANRAAEEIRRGRNSVPELQEP